LRADVLWASAPAAPPHLWGDEGLLYAAPTPTTNPPHIPGVSHHATPPKLRRQAAGLTAHRSPLTAHRSPLTAHRSPLTAHRSPLTAHRSPLRAHRSGLRAQGSGLRAQGSGLRAQGSGLRAQGSGRLCATSSSTMSTRQRTMVVALQVQATERQQLVTARFPRPNLFGSATSPTAHELRQPSRSTATPRAGASRTAPSRSSMPLSADAAPADRHQRHECGLPPATPGHLPSGRSRRRPEADLETDDHARDRRLGCSAVGASTVTLPPIGATRNLARRLQSDRAVETSSRGDLEVRRPRDAGSVKRSRRQALGNTTVVDTSGTS
jgi:hypothetical protein